MTLEITKYFYYDLKNTIPLARRGTKITKKQEITPEERSRVENDIRYRYKKRRKHEN